MSTLVVIALLCAFCPGAQGAPPEVRFQQEMAKCEAIPPKKYRTGMLFNPDGYRTYYERSRCIQKVAIEYRDIDLCEQVKKRWSLFFSGFAYSEKACREGVQERLARDQAAAAAIDVENIYRLENVYFERYSNGRDFNLHIRTEGSISNTYVVLIEAWEDGRSESIVFDEYSQPLTPKGHTPTHYFREEKIRSALGSGSLDHDLRVRITLTLAPRSHDDYFILSQIPVVDRSSQFEVDVNFAKL